jgi:hypothetical protein
LILRGLNLSDTATRELKSKIEAYSLANRFVGQGSPADQAEVAMVVGSIQAGPSAPPSAPAGQRPAAVRGKGLYNRPGERSAMNKEKDKTKKLAMLLAIVNHSDNPTEGGGNESWRSWLRNAEKVKICHDVCHGGNGATLLAMYAPGTSHFSYGTWVCRCDQSEE